MKGTRTWVILLVGNLRSSSSLCIPHACFPGLKKAAGSFPPSSTATLRARWKSTAAARNLWMKALGRGGGVCFHPGLWKGAMEMGFNNSCWRRLVRRGGRGGPTELWEECPLRNSLFLPAAPTSPCGAGAGQEGSHSPSAPQPPPAQILCAQRPTNSPSLREKGSTRTYASSHFPWLMMS